MPSLVAANLPAEDGSILFQGHYQEWSLAACFRTWAGYMSLVPNLLAAVESRLPALYVPYAFAVTAWLLLLIAVTRFLDRRFDAVASLPVRVVIVGAFAWVPFGEAMISTCLMYSQVPLLFWLALILLRPAGRNRPILDGLLVTLFTWTHPLSVGLIPISVWRLREGSMRPVAITHLLASGVFLLFGREGGSTLNLARLGEAPAWFLVRVVFETFFGTSTKAAWFAEDRGWLAIAIGAVVVAALIGGVCRAWPRWSPATRQLVLGLTWMSIMSVAAVLVLRGPSITQQWETRYPWPGRIALVTITLLVVTTLVRAGWAVILVAVWTPWLAHFDWRYFSSGRAPELSAFLQQVTAQEQRLGDRRALDARLERPELGPWFAIELKPR